MREREVIKAVKSVYKEMMEDHYWDKAEGAVRVGYELGILTYEEYCKYINKIIDESTKSEN